MKRTWEISASSSTENGHGGSAPIRHCSNDLVHGAQSHSSATRCRFIDRGRPHMVQLSIRDSLLLPAVSVEAQEFRQFIRAHYMSSVLGWSAKKIASELQRTEQWVNRSLQRSVATAPFPRDFPRYVCNYELRMLQAGVEPFRPPELRRGYVSDTAGLYEHCAQQMPWQQAMIRNRNHQTGELTVTGVPSNRQDCIYRGIRTGIARLDEAIQRLCLDLKVEDPHAFLVNNWYPDGKASIGAHSHDHWSAILSFGASRVFLLDDRPLLLGDGDLLVFGTQRHSLPKMPEVSGGRVSVALFWYPEQRASDDRRAQESRCARCGLSDVLLQEAPNGSSYCELCWADCLQSQSCRLDNDVSVEDDMLAVALQLSMVEQ